MYIDSRGMTCDKLAVEMADTHNGSRMGNGECTALQNAYRGKCCDKNTRATSVAQTPTKAPNFGLRYGGEPICDLCGDGGKPGTGHTIIAMLYMQGTHTCNKVYEMGQKGHILDKLCKPLKKWAVEPCGCNIGPGRSTSSGRGDSVELDRSFSSSTTTTNSNRWDSSNNNKNNKNNKNKKNKKDMKRRNL